MVRSRLGWKSLMRVHEGRLSPAGHGSAAGVQGLLGTAAAAGGPRGTALAAAPAQRGRVRLVPDGHFRLRGTSGAGRCRRRAPWEAGVRRVRHTQTHTQKYTRTLSVLGGCSFVAFVEPKNTVFQDKKDKKAR